MNHTLNLKRYLLICMWFFLINFRYKAIVNPMDIQTSSAVLWTYVKAIAIWVVSMLLAVPEVVFSELAHINDTNNATFTACIPYPMTDDMHPKIHSVLIFLVYFLIPLAIISIYYYHIAKSLIKSAHNIPGEYSEHSKKQVSNLLFTSQWKICALYTLINESAGTITSKWLDFAEDYFSFYMHELSQGLSVKSSCFHNYSVLSPVGKW